MNTTTWVAAAATLIFAAGCGSPEEMASAPMQHAADAQAGDALGTITGAGPWTVQATDGSKVTLTRAAPDWPIGSVEVRAVIETSEGDRWPHSADLVSPTMPMHGLVRYEVSEGTVELDIPMEGRWALYVNVDGSGVNTAEFVFDVGRDADSQH